MVNKILTIGEIEIEKHKFYRYKGPIFCNVLVSNKISSSKKNHKYFCLYDDYKIKLLHIMRSKTGVYVKSYDGQTKIFYWKNIILISSDTKK